MFYDNVYKLCYEHRIKMTALARKLNLSPSAPKRWENGSMPKPDTIKKIAEYFGVTTDYLLYGDSAEDRKPGTVEAETIQHGPNETAVWLTDQEEELIRVYRNLNARTKHEMMSYAYALDEKQRLGV